jgi:hypothetical protein
MRVGAVRLLAMCWIALGCSEGVSPAFEDAGTPGPDGSVASGCFDFEIESLDERVPGFCSRGIDTDLDGELDIESFYQYEGGLLVSLSERDPDDPPQQTWEYDADGNLLVHQGFDDDEALRWSEAYSYDGAGNPLSWTQDLDGDGEGDRIETYAYACFDVEERHPGPCTIEYDDDADGSIDGTTVREWDDDGLLLEEVSRAADTTAEPVTRTYRYDDDGQLLTIDIDSNGDGEADDRLGNDYDDDGSLIRDWYDSGANGSLDLKVEYARDAEGHVVAHSHYRGEDLVHSVVLERDRGGNIVRETYIDHDGDEEDISVQVSRFDDAGNLVARAVDASGDGRYDSCERYTYECW